MTERRYAPGDCPNRAPVSTTKRGTSEIAKLDGAGGIAHRHEVEAPHAADLAPSGHEVVNGDEPLVRSCRLHRGAGKAPDR